MGNSIGRNEQTTPDPDLQGWQRADSAGKHKRSTRRQRQWREARNGCRGERAARGGRGAAVIHRKPGAEDEEEAQGDGGRGVAYAAELPQESLREEVTDLP